MTSIDTLEPIPESPNTVADFYMAPADNLPNYKSYRWHIVGVSIKLMSANKDKQLLVFHTGIPATNIRIPREQGRHF